MATQPTSSQILKTTSGGNAGFIKPLPEFPKLPDDIKKRFPSMAEWERKMIQYEKQKAQLQP